MEHMQDAYTLGNQPGSSVPAREEEQSPEHPGRGNKRSGYAQPAQCEGPNCQWQHTRTVAL
jgi:hypothetical protein